MLEIKNTSIIVHDYNLGDNKTLENYLTVFDKMSNGFLIPKFRAYYFDEENNQLILPRGYSIPRLQSILNDYEIFYNKNSDKSKNIILNCNSEPRDELQKKAIDYLIEKDTSLLKNNFNQKFLCLKTGKGKTFCMINAICKLKRRAIILVDTLSLAEQWRDSFFKFTDIKEKQIIIVSGMPTINKIMKEKDFELDYKIFIVMDQTMTSLIKRNPEKVTKFFNKIKVGIKVYDEAHNSWAAITSIDALTNTAKNFYLTATPGRSNPEENRLYSYIFQTIPVFGRDNTENKSYKYSSEVVNKNEAYHSVYYINYDSNPSYNEQLEMTKRDRFDMNLFSDYTRTKKYNLFLFVILKIIDICLNQKGDRKIAIILIKNDMIQTLYESLNKVYPEITVGRFCGLVSAKEKFKELDNKIILSTDKSLGKAIDIKNLGFLINTVPFASSVIAEQMLGRLRRNDRLSYLFDITDLGFANCKNNQKYRANTYNKIALKNRTATYELTDNEINDFLKEKGYL